MADTQGSRRAVSRRKRRKRGDVPKSLTLYVVFSISVLIIYTVTEQILSTMWGISHDTLTTCIFAAFGGEILACALIKIFKLRSSEDTETSERS